MESIGFRENNETFKYSYDEVKTGKKWIDGEPIYRKTFAVPADTTNDSAVEVLFNTFTVGGFFKVLDGGVLRTHSNGTPLDYVMLPFVDQADGYNIQVASTLAKDRAVVNCGANVGQGGGWLTMEYTKA